MTENDGMNKGISFLCAREISLDHFRASDSADADMRLINRFSLSELRREDVSIVTMDLVNDKVDRHHSRFPEKEIKRISRMIEGKPLMVNHDMPGMFSSGSLPRGTFFRGAFIKDAAGARAMGDAYILRGRRNDDFVSQIGAGVYRGTSVSFAFERAECSICGTNLQECAHWPGKKYDGQRCHYIMHDVYDVFEQSIVPLGSQSTEVLSVRGALFTQDTFLQALRDAGKPAESAENAPIEKTSLQNEAPAVESAANGMDAATIHAEVNQKLKAMRDRDLANAGE